MDDMNCCEGNKIEELKKITIINEALNMNIKDVNENYRIINEINDFLLLKKKTITPDSKSEMPAVLGWFDRVIENLRIINCRNTDINIHLNKLYKEVIEKSDRKE